jgi:hypothetical protein
MRMPLLAGTLLLVAAMAEADPIAVSRVNPHYFTSNGRPVVLVTSDHHYGAVIDRDFDYVRYLDAIAAAGMNLTRIYPGAMFEVADKYVAGNPLGPRPGRHILPWARSTVPGAHASLAEPGAPSFKFDLDRSNPEYFARLRAFVAAAAARDIVVEVAFFNGMYADSWPLMPMYHANNVQGVGAYEAGECGLFTTADPRNRDVMRYQAAYVARIAAELNEFDNLIYDIADEPLLQGKPDGSIVTLDETIVVPWLTAMATAFRDAEASKPKKHVLGQTVQSLSPDLSAEAWVEWLPTEYVKAAGAALAKNYGAGKPLVNVESDYYGHGLVKPYTPDDVRLEGWWFMLGGGAGVINLNGEFHRGQEAGGTDSRERILPERRVLKQFLDRLDLDRMTRFGGVKTEAGGTRTSAIADPGRAYAVYLFHANDDGQWGAHFVAAPGAYRDAVTLTAVPAGAYHVTWIDPATGRALEHAEVQSPGGDLTVTTPPYSLDVALLLTRAR